MKIYSIPKNCTTIIFDIDSTLYTNANYAFEQVDVQVRHYAKLKGLTNDEARKQIATYREHWAKTHNGQKISLGNTLLAFDIPIEQSVEWRKELLEPKDFLSKDVRLISTLTELQKKCKLICVTNNPVLPAFKTLEALGIEKIIPDIIGLDTCYKSKPAKEPFLLAVKQTNSEVTNCLSVGDRYDMDISLALELGMGGVLVSGVEDVYKLPEVLKEAE